MLEAFALYFQDRLILESAAEANPESAVSRPVEEVFLGYPHGPKTSQFVPEGRKARQREFVVRGNSFTATVHGSSESWTVSTKSTHIGSGYGGAISSSDDAVYDRQGDWLLKFEGTGLSINAKGANRYAVVATGEGIKVTLYEHYYRDHLGYSLWGKPQKLWNKPVMGWCYWMAHLQKVTAEDMLRASSFFAKNLKDYGYDIVQMDDGFQRSPQLQASGYTTSEKVADLWTKPNEKFPAGLQALAAGIRKDGMTPGIWVGLYLPISPFVPAYITGPDGKPYRGPWVNYAVNGLDQKALQAGYLETFIELKRQGWGYIKVDTLRHVLYDNYRLNTQYWAARNQSMEEAYRRILSEIKKVWGSSVYLLACWGTIPELAGIPDGCRIGEDVGPDLDSMQRTAKYVAQFHSLNNVLWHNDPDYMCFRVGLKPAQSWASLLALTGCQLMVSDPIETYDEPRLDILRRVGPTAFVRPKNVRPLPPDPELALFHGSKQGEAWTVAGRFAFREAVPARRVSFNELGLASGGKYLAFDFWNSRFLGEHAGGVDFQPLARGECQVVSFRPLQNQPQVLGTDRHILQGAHELSDVRWRESALSGKMSVEKGRQWSLFVHVSTGYRPVLEPGMSLEGPVLKVTFPESGGTRTWKVAFKKA
jgi:hypothetical protein